VGVLRKDVIIERLELRCVFGSGRVRKVVDATANRHDSDFLNYDAAPKTLFQVRFIF